ncbi:hypothetical protein E2C01_020901 [Portunus trituberculatus]|uniref:Uncharacterized protein n=1 Tax=Portunus trituberculatus TaxID=210409 RepID=A0A5B7E3A6_PORTR|nr:hypothetical protein [Portunus trituberculatus]
MCMGEKRRENKRTGEAIAHGHRFACSVVSVIVIHTSKRRAIILPGGAAVPGSKLPLEAVINTTRQKCSTELSEH